MDSKALIKECALCGNPISKSSSAPIEEKIGQTSYRFDTKDCAVMFKRFHAVYGDDFEQVSGHAQHIAAAEQEFKVKGIEKQEKQRDRSKKETPEIVKITEDPTEILRLSNKLVNSARDKIQVVFSSAALFNYYYNYQMKESQGGFQLLERAATRKVVDVKIIIPSDEKIKVMLSRPSLYELPRIQIRFIEEIGILNKDIMLLIVDRKHSLVMKLKENRESVDLAERKTHNDVARNQDDAFEEMIELGTYSNNIPIVLSYAIVFDTLWKQLELNKQISSVFEQLRAQENARGDLLSIAAHEFRDPIQPVLGLAEMLQSKKKVDPQEQEEFLAIIIRNAKRLKALTENILDLTRVESQSSLNLHKEIVDIKEILQNSVSDIKSQLSRDHTVKIKVKDNTVKVQHGEHPSEAMLIEADRSKLMQVISNLLSNAIKFTEVGAISITVENKADTSNSKYNSKEVIVSIKDNGKGIHPSIMPNLFEKFATKSDKSRGLGLGLFISKSIITSHGGKMWAENNPEGKGATFSFSLPLIA